jgi:hypothetical protein
MGHNRPPPDVFEAEGDLQEDDPAATAKELREEIEKPRPQVSVAKRLLRSLGWAFEVSAKYAAQKIDKAIDAAATATGKAAGTGLVVTVAATQNTQVQQAVSAVWHAAIHWLDLATSLF